MANRKITRRQKTSGMVIKPILTLVLALLMIAPLFSACAAPDAGSKPPITSGVASVTPSVVTTSITAEAKPQGELIVALSDFGNENFLPWKSTLGAAQTNLLVYDTLIYYDVVNRKFLPGLAESWDISPDAMTTTFHLRKGVQFQDGWGEFTSEDLKYNFEKQAGKDSNGLTTIRAVASMDLPDSYTLVAHMRTPQPTIFSLFSLGNGGTCQGFVSKKYIETVGETVASQKPIGTGPYKMIDHQTGSYYKFEALDNHWRVVPEFKTLTVRLVPEMSTTVAMLKTKEVDLAMVTAEQLPDLKASGLATEVSPYGGGGNIVITLGGMVAPEDSRYDPAYHNKDPWVDIRVRKALAISIDRQAICNSIFAGGASPDSVPLHSPDKDKYQYPYDPAAAKQLLIDAGYPNGFSFKAISYTISGMPETPRLVEALAGYWQQIGLDPQITVYDYSSYGSSHRTPLKTAGELSLFRIAPVADMLDKASVHLMPEGQACVYQDSASYAIWKEGVSKIDADEREKYVEQLNQYYFDNYAPISVITIGSTWAWNSAKISIFPHAVANSPYYMEYVRHAQPVNTFRLFTPLPGR
jgi:ABC-type transport system substrate-binding protein